MSAIDCIACSKTMQNLMDPARGIQPLGGLAFLTRGHYGSMFFDPMDGSSLEIAVCDECLAGAVNGVSIFPERARPAKSEVAE